MLPIRQKLVGTDEKVPWSILAAFQDLDARQRVIRVCDNMVIRFWPDRQFEMHLCAFDQLETPEMSKVAARHVSRANMIIIAFNADACLSPPVKRWMNKWRDYRQGREGTLIALIEGSPANPALEKSHQDLRKVAHRAGLDYLTHEPAFAPAPLSDEFGWYERRAAEVGSVLGNILDRPFLPPS